MSRRAHRSTLVIGLVVATLVLAACQSGTDSDSPTPLATVGGAASAPPSGDADGDGDDEGGEETSVFDLERGDCFSATGDQVETVTVVDCERPHLYEVFGVFDHEAGDDDPYPGDDAILEYADDACQPLFEAFVGSDYQSSIYWITSVTPSDETWNEADDREIVCALKLGETATETTGSAEGTAE
jgi:hypothetical protein